MTTIARVRLWGTEIGRVALQDESSAAVFEYDRNFVRSGIQPAPLTMRLSDRVYSFPSLNAKTFHGLPGLLSDSLPDKFGGIVLDAYLKQQGREKGSLNPVERLCYIGKRGMGALEYDPVIGPDADEEAEYDISKLSELAADILAERENVKIDANDDAMRQLQLASTSAGGARAKAVVAWNERLGVFRSGQIEAGDGFVHWLLKFDGMADNKDREEADKIGYTHTEFAYYLMAKAAGITISECRLYEEKGRHHFMTKRFDRVGDAGEKIHMQTLGAIAHLDFNMAGAYSYEDAITVMRRLRLTQPEMEELYRRAIFNVMARNQDDHVKNISFLMGKDGRWTLAPAYDLTYAYNPNGLWTSRHQMSLNDKREGFAKDDLLRFAGFADIGAGRAERIITQVREAIASWDRFAYEASVFDGIHNEVSKNLLLL